MLVFPSFIEFLHQIFSGSNNLHYGTKKTAQNMLAFAKSLLDPSEIAVPMSLQGERLCSYMIGIALSSKCTF